MTTIPLLGSNSRTDRQGQSLALSLLGEVSPWEALRALQHLPLQRCPFREIHLGEMWLFSHEWEAI